METVALVIVLAGAASIGAVAGALGPMAIQGFDYLFSWLESKK